MATIRFEGHPEGPFEIELPDDKAEAWQAHAAARGQTLSESFEEILREFMAQHARGEELFGWSDKREKS